MQKFPNLDLPLRQELDNMSPPQPEHDNEPEPQLDMRPDAGSMADQWSRRSLPILPLPPIAGTEEPSSGADNTFVPVMEEMSILLKFIEFIRMLPRMIILMKIQLIQFVTHPKMGSIWRMLMTDIWLMCISLSLPPLRQHTMLCVWWLFIDILTAAC